MKCANCGKKPATVHLTEIDDDGQKYELHLCETCAEILAHTNRKGPQRPESR